VAEMKNQVSGFDVRRLVFELQKLVGAFLDKVYQLEKNELIIRFNIKGEGKAELYMNFSGHLYLCSESKAKPESPSTFAMVLRKHLSNARVEAVSQHEFDRIIIIDLFRQYKFRLVLELFGEGNAVLIQDDDSGSRIINTLFQRSWSARTLRPGHPYDFPPGRLNPLTAKMDDLAAILVNSKRDLVRTLALDVNLGGLYAEEVLERAALDKKEKASNLTETQISLIFNTVKELFDELETQFNPQVVYSDDKPIDVVPFDLKIYESNKSVPVPELSAGLETYFSESTIIGEKTKSEAETKLENEKARLRRQLDQQKEAVEKFGSISQEKKTLADKIYHHYQLIDSVLKSISELRKQYSWDEIIDEEMLKFDELVELNPNEALVKIKLPADADSETEVLLALDIRLNVNQNAEIYYEASKSAREKQEGAAEALKSTEMLLKKIELSISRTGEPFGPDTRDSFSDNSKRKVFWFEKYKWFISSEGFLTLAGSDAQSNEKIVKKYLRQGDRYVHADLHGAPSAVVRRKDAGDDSIPENTLKEACNFAVVHSKAWNAGIAAANAYWVNADQVSKTPQSGEFVPKGAFIVRGKRNYVKDIELKVAVGFIEHDGVFLLMCGPITAIISKTEKYLVLIPGRSKKTTIAKKLSSIFKIPLDDIMKLLPPGDLEIADSVGIEVNGAGYVH